MSEVIPSISREIEVDQILDSTSGNLTGFGLSFLDDALVGIMPNDLCLISAKSGIGKTQLATAIAAYNANVCKKNVVYIALEAEKNEIEMRLKYSIEASLFFKDQQRDRSVVISYRKWRLGFLQKDFKKYKDEAASIFIQRYNRLHTVYKEQHYGIKEFERTLDQAKDFGDLYLVDHLNYFSLEGSQSENQEVSQIMKRIRDLNLYYSKPFIVIAHLRKNTEGLVPSLDDLMGSSDIPKIATVCVMLTKDSNGYDPKTQLQKTIISIPKARTGALGNLCGAMSYSIVHQMYLPQYDLVRVKGEKFESIKEEEHPEWVTQQKPKIPQAKTT